MNRRQAKKELKKRYGYTLKVPRRGSLRKYKRLLDEAFKVAAKVMADIMDDLIIKGV